jgi:hypothetical protein
MDVVSCIDALRNAATTEITLRNEANREWANGIKDGPMMTAHKASIANVIDAAKNLLAASQGLV